MSDIRMVAAGVEAPLPADAVIETERPGRLLRLRATVAITPSVSADGTHRHEVRRGDSGRRDLLAVPTFGVRAAPLRWVDTDEVSHCSSACDGDHETWYVQKLVCPMCDADLSPIVGEVSEWLAGDIRRTLRCSLPGVVVVDEVVVLGLDADPVTFRGETSLRMDFGGVVAHFEGVA